MLLSQRLKTFHQGSAAGKNDFFDCFIIFPFVIENHSTGFGQDIIQNNHYRAVNIFVFFVSGKTDFSFDRFGARGGNTHGARQGERYVLRTLVNDVRVSDHPAFGDNDLGA